MASFSLRWVFLRISYRIFVGFLEGFLGFSWYSHRIMVGFFIFGAQLLFSKLLRLVQLPQARLLLPTLLQQLIHIDCQAGSVDELTEEFEGFLGSKDQGTQPCQESQELRWLSSCPSSKKQFFPRFSS